MRFFPRFTRPSFKSVAQRLRRLRRHLSAPRAVVIVEGLIFSGVLLFALTGGRAAIVGMFELGAYEQEAVPMLSGDVLIAFTDGLSEALNVNGEEFGEARIQAVLAATAQLSASEISAAIVQRAQVWCAGAPQHDDLTFIVLKVK